MKMKTFGKILAIVAVVLVGIVWAFSVAMYEMTINQRYETYAPLAFKVSDFEELERTRYEFASNKRQVLVGYAYKNGATQKGLIVIAHGLGAGHNDYMDLINYFAKSGFYVFAYDATGNDESEGDGVRGLPQGVIDLDAALNFVKSKSEFQGLPICLFGHSWGAYSVCSVLEFHSDIKAVVECSGANSSSDFIEGTGKLMFGDVVEATVPFIKLHEWFKFGNYANASGLNGFASSDARVMVVHSSDDDVVPIEYGYDIFYKMHANDERFTFVRFEDKGHGNILVDKSNMYKDEFNEEFYRWRDTLGYDWKDKSNNERYQLDRSNYITEHLDRTRWASRLDETLAAMFVEFYEK